MARFSNFKWERGLFTIKHFMETDMDNDGVYDIGVDTKFTVYIANMVDCFVKMKYSNPFVAFYSLFTCNNTRDREVQEYAMQFDSSCNAIKYITECTPKTARKALYTIYRLYALSDNDINTMSNTVYDLTNRTTRFIGNVKVIPQVSCWLGVGKYSVQCNEQEYFGNVNAFNLFPDEMTGMIDLVAGDTLYDIKTSKKKPDIDEIRQIVFYYYACKYGMTDAPLPEIKKIGFINPILGKCWTIKVEDIPYEVLETYDSVLSRQGAIYDKAYEKVLDDTY